MKNIYFAYLHSCGLTQSDLLEIFESGEENEKEFYKGLSEVTLRSYVKNSVRRSNILKHYKKFEKNQKEKEKIENTLKKLDVKLISIKDGDYPESLKNIPHTPFLLYVRGKIPERDMFGVVGSRKISMYGKKVITKIVPDVSKVFPIVSGGAAGCDTEAHKASLDSGNRTIVVVGTGIDQCYPVSNKKLFDDIIQSDGAVVSIFRIGEPGNPYNFPVRNEIVVGLVCGILVVEAKEKSGSLITANLALDLGKDLFSVPGEITNLNSGGTNMLIRNGEAKCVLDQSDILEEYDILLKKSTHKEQLPLLDSLESTLYNHLVDGDKNIDQLSDLSKNSSSEIGVKLSMLELKGIIKKSLNGKYTLC